jgi:hypothetical protein
MQFVRRRLNLLSEFRPPLLCFGVVADLMGNSSGVLAAKFTLNEAEYVPS